MVKAAVDIPHADILGKDGSPMSFRKQLLGIMLLLALLPALSAVVLISNSFIQNTEQMLRENVANATLVHTSQLESFLGQRKINLEIIGQYTDTLELLNQSNSGQRGPDYEEKHSALTEHLSIHTAKQNFLLRVSLMDQNDIIVASSERDRVGEKALLQMDAGTLVESELCFTGVVSDPAFFGGLPHVVAVYPIYREGVYQGCLLEAMDLSYFDRLVRESQYFKTGIVGIWDDAGKVVAAGSGYLQGNIEDLEAGSDLSEQFCKVDLSHSPQGFLEYEMGQVPKIAYYSTVGNSGWAVVSAVERSEISASVREVMIRTGLFIGIMLLLVAGLNLLVRRSLTQPVQQILDTIHALQAGNLSRRCGYRRADEFGEIAAAFNSMMDQLEQNDEALRQNNLEMEALTSNLPGGVLRCSLDDGYPLEYVSDGFLKMTGYSRRELVERFDNHLLGLVRQEDRNILEQQLHSQLDVRKVVDAEVQFQCRNGGSLWGLLRGRVIEGRNGERSIFCVILDVTDAKHAQDELRQSEERYRIILEQSDDIICEWDLRSDRFTCSSHWMKMFGYMPRLENPSKVWRDTDKVHPEDMPRFLRWLEETYRGQLSGEDEFRLRDMEGNFRWVRFQVTILRDMEGNPIRALGAIKDIDREKTQLQELLDQARTDSLTGLFNKGTTAALVTKAIEEAGPNGQGALLMIDIDNFKGVNDRMGHLYGDEMLTKIAQAIVRNFRSSDIVGRVGGDEFLAYLRNTAKPELVLAKSQRLIASVEALLWNTPLRGQVSLSIGIALYPAHGADYLELLGQADVALYHAKAKGKCQAVLCSPELKQE